MASLRWNVSGPLGLICAERPLLIDSTHEVWHGDNADAAVLVGRRQAIQEFAGAAVGGGATLPPA
jgi:hypothetical protein